MSDEIETIDKNPKSWAAWKREAERLQEIIDGMALAAREAVPAAEVISRGHLAHVTDADLELGTKLYTAPPAPAVPNEKAITPFFDTLALDTAKMVMCDVNRRSDFLGGDIQLLARIQCRVDEACRAAMLAQPVSRGCKLPEGWVACIERLPEQKPGSKEYLVYETLNNRVQHDYWNVEDGSTPEFTPFWNHYGGYVTHWMPLPAAPEGGNG